ncbi:hypothetical protein EG68_01833 [Paragonimus skrjabini miyazakii]|uniref:Uncharacterized protein n=1 Tax=Paragonimus skrjabini miyazakii TaxID=59628 RepID=A0A8S9Z0L7_9TREM|nr:hypothetical protein EG68_01833 [Paragonimus skrjabini miyazakii]
MLTNRDTNRRWVTYKIPRCYVGSAIQTQPGRSASFEITVNDVLVFSKLVNGDFPNEQAVIEQIRNASKGQQPISIT